MMLLLDTHTLLWFLREPEKLSSGVLEAIESAGRDARVSIVSLWEIAIKVSLNKLTLPRDYDELFPRSVADSGLSLLGLEASHISAVCHLPWHHRDPFDRLLLAQAKVEGLALVSCDQNFPPYGVPLLW